MPVPVNYIDSLLRFCTPGRVPAAQCVTLFPPGQKAVFVPVNYIASLLRFCTPGRVRDLDISEPTFVVNKAIS